MAGKRVKAVDVSRLSIQEAEQLSTQLGEKVREITDKAMSEINAHLNLYQMEAKMQVFVGPIKELTKLAEKPKKTRKTNKKKDANL